MRKHFIFLLISMGMEELVSAVENTLMIEEQNINKSNLMAYEACGGVMIEPYKDETQLREIMAMIEEALSEPYSVYTYRYFINHCPELCWLARDPSTGKAVGAIVSRLDMRKGRLRGYIAMLAVSKTHRKRGIGRI